MIQQYIYKILWGMLCLLFSAAGMAATFTVTNTNDAGAGSLRQAIIDANGAGPGPHTIDFAPALSGQTIFIFSSLPQVNVADVTIDGDIDGDGTGDITIDAGVGNAGIYVFRGLGGATNMTVRGFTIQDTGFEAFRFDGSPVGITIEDIVFRNNDGNFINYGIFFPGNAQDLTVTNFDMENGEWGWYGIDITGTATNVMIDNFSYSNGGGNNAYGIRIRGIANDVTIQNSTIDLDLPGNTNDGDFAIAFDNTNTNTTIDNVVIHDAEVYGLFFGTATDVVITNTTIDNFDGASANQLIRFNGTVNNLAMTNVTLNGDTNATTNDGDYGIFFNNTATDCTFTDLTIDNQDLYGIYFNVSNTITFNNFNMSNAEGFDAAYGIRFVGVANDIVVNTATIDMDISGTTDDSNYGIIFETTATNVALDGITMHDAEIYGLYFGGVTTDVSITNSSFDNFDGWIGNQMIRFNSTVNGLTMTNVTIDEDITGSTDDGNYGIYSLFHINLDDSKNAVLTNVSINQADEVAFFVSPINNGGITNNLTIDGCNFTGNSETNTRNGGVEFWHGSAKTDILITNSTFTNLGSQGIFIDTDGVTNSSNIDFTNNTISGIVNVAGLAYGIRLLDGPGVKDIVISGNTIFNCELAGIRIEQSDGINITQNNIYNNPQGIDNANNNGNNDLEFVDGDTAYIISSVNTAVDTYDVTFNVPAFCTNCDVEFFTNNVGDINYNGRAYAQTVTGLSAAGNPHTFSINSGGNNTGFWTTTIKDINQNSSVSEFGNPYAINPDGPADVVAGIRLWMKADASVTGAPNVSQWDDISGNPVFTGNQPEELVAGDQPSIADNVVNFNPAIFFEGADDRLVTPTQVYSHDFRDVPGQNATAYVVANSTAASDGAFFDHGGSGAGNFIVTTQRSSLGQSSTLNYTTDVDTQFRIVSGIRAGSGTSTMYLDGALNGTVNDADISDVNYRLRIGVNDLNGNDMIGNIAEIVVYGDGHTVLDQQKVQTYLAVKYGITLPHNYIASDGTTTVWDLTTNVAYNNNIFGLGNDASMLDQKVSRSINTPAATVADLIVASDNDFVLPNTDGSRTSLTNGQYILFGDDGGDASTRTSVEFDGTRHFARIDKEWLVQNTNSVGNINLQFLNLPALAADEFYTLAVDADGDFSDGNATDLRMSTTNIFEDVTIPNGIRYMTILITKVDAVLTTQQDGDETGPVNIIYRVSLQSPTAVPLTNLLIGDIVFDITDLLTGTATPGVGLDYTAIPGGTQVTVSSGNAFQDFVVVVNDDVVIEDTETVIVQIANPSVTQVNIITADATANIVDNEPRNFMRHGKVFIGGTEQPMRF